jgi:hypothetical protein
MEITKSYDEYERRSYCKSINCPIQRLLDQTKPGSVQYEDIRLICRDYCLHTTHEFHDWLKREGYIIIKQREKSEYT